MIHVDTRQVFKRFIDFFTCIIIIKFYVRIAFCFALRSRECCFPILNLAQAFVCLFLCLGVLVFFFAFILLCVLCTSSNCAVLHRPALVEAFYATCINSTSPVPRTVDVATGCHQLLAPRRSI